MGRKRSPTNSKKVRQESRGSDGPTQFSIVTPLRARERERDGGGGGRGGEGGGGGGE